jgi:hypothetical protein
MFTATTSPSSPYIRSLTGKLPSSKNPVVAGIRLPAGHRDRGGLLLWSSDRSVANAVDLAKRLAAAFPRTGLWPVLWPDWDQPAGYMDGTFGVDRIARVNVERFLASRWAVLGRSGPPYGGSFPGLAHRTARRGAENPFSIFARHQSDTGYDPQRFQLLLIPCRRPADAISVVGFEIQGPADGSFSALLRSWEDRFGAYLVMLSPDGSSGFAVASPPRSGPDAHRLAAEILAASPPQADPNALTELTLSLLGDRVSGYQHFDPSMNFTGGTWGFALGDD